MRNGRTSITGLSLAAAAAIIVPARAQDSAPTPAPAPAQTPSTIPGVVPERFSIGPAVTPPPIVVPTPTPTANATPRPVAAAPVRQQPVPRPTPSAAPAAAVPAAAATPSAAPTAAPSPVASPITTSAPVATSTPAPLPAPARHGLPGWLWALAGAGAAALAFGAYRLLRVPPEREAEPEELAPVAAPAAAAPPLPPSPPRPVAPPPGLAPAPAAAEPFEIALRPVRIDVGTQEVVLELELLVGNRQPQPAEAIRVQIAPMSANPDQDRRIAGFHAAAMLDGGVQPFDLAAGAGGRMPVRLALAREQLHVVQVGGRAMFVPMILVDLRWRSGISIRRFGADFMLGTAGQGGKVGPIWLDRPTTAPLAATRYLPRASAAAA